MRSQPFPGPPAALGWALLALAPACSMPQLEEQPWAMTRAGGVSISLDQPVASSYRVDADFTAITPVEGVVRGSDSERVEGKYGLALSGEVFLFDGLSLGLGAEYRHYEIQNLAPDGLPPVYIDPIRSMQYSLALRGYPAWFGADSRWRPLLGLSLIYLPEVDIKSEIDLSGFGLPSNPVIDTTGQPYWMLAGTLGVAYQLADHFVLRGGAIYEHPLTTLDADLSLSVAGSTLPFYVEMQPSGVIGFLGISYFF